MAGHTEDAVERVQVLVQGDLEHRRSALTVEIMSPMTFQAMMDEQYTYREMMVEYARKKTQMRYQRSP